MAVAYNAGSIVTNGLVFHADFANRNSYPASGITLTDMSGSLQGTLTNGPVYSGGNAGQLTFDGSDDFVTYGDQSSLGLTGDTTIEVWMYIPSSWTTGSLYPNIVSKGADSGFDTAGWALFAFRPNSPGTENWIGIGVRDGVGPSYRYFTNTLLDQWFHVVGVRTASTVIIYQNGIQRENNTLSRSPATNSTPVYIGRGTSGYFNGRIANVKLYNRVLSAAEVTQNFNALRGRFGI